MPLDSFVVYLTSPPTVQVTTRITTGLKVAQQHHKYTGIRLTCQYPQATPSAAVNASTQDSSLEESPERLRLLKFRNLDAVSPMKLEALMKPANQDGIEWYQINSDFWHIRSNSSMSHMVHRHPPQGISDRVEYADLE
ncbi:hypothetical protein ARMGADRAFT_1038121 [Armillaria gallica]|uniref:Uncharacterized protein n=1 Tax=Armillaria gallica TaxID=47427 RepID=A0A2H3D493_ARMGA|nr:hypothetical protein ARMGADRAFT_1038121 [Armillaria gallica]